jgi:hypothetical protein
MAAKEYRMIDFVTEDSLLGVSPIARNAGLYPFTHKGQYLFLDTSFATPSCSTVFVSGSKEHEGHLSGG